MNKYNPSTVVIDGEFFLHRVLHIPELAEMRTADGRQTGGIFGVLHSIYVTLRKFPEVGKCIVVFDDGHSARRKELLPTYKANRRQAKPGHEQEYEKSRLRFQEQKDYLLRNLETFGTRLAVVPGKEGDDVIGWFARRCEEDLLIATEDKDMLQLVNNHVAVYQPIKENFVSLNNFETITGVIKSLFLLGKAILGDPSDNIKGVPKAGEVTVNRLMDSATFFVANRSVKTLSEAVQKAANVQQEADHRNRARYESIVNNLDIVSRNLKLMDLRLEPFTQEEESNLNRVLDGSKGVFCELEALEVLESLEFRQLLAGWAEFSRVFRRLH